MDLQHKSSTPLRAKDIMPHPISKLSGPRACGPRAYPSLARGYGPGLGLKFAGRAKHSRSGSGLNSSLWAWAGLEKLLRAWAGPGL